MTPGAWRTTPGLCANVVLPGGFRVRARPPRSSEDYLLVEIAGLSVSGPVPEADVLSHLKRCFRKPLDAGSSALAVSLLLESSAKLAVQVTTWVHVGLLFFCLVHVSFWIISFVFLALSLSLLLFIFS